MLYFIQQKTAYTMRISEWSSDVCSSDLQLPALQAVLPASVKLNLAMDRSPVIKATLPEAEMTLLIAVALVVLVVFLFLGNFRASLIPTLAVPVSLVGRSEERRVGKEWVSTVRSRRPTYHKKKKKR